MPTIDRIQGYADELTSIRRDLHAHPEIGFEEIRTSGIVAEKLAQWGIDVHRGFGGTGVIGVLKGKGNGGTTPLWDEDPEKLKLLRQYVRILEGKLDGNNFKIEPTSYGFVLKKRVDEDIKYIEAWERWVVFSRTLYNELLNIVGD